MRRTMSSMSKLATVLLLGLAATASAFDRPHLRMTLAATGEQVLPTSEDLAAHQVCVCVGRDSFGGGWGFGLLSWGRGTTCMHCRSSDCMSHCSA